MIICAAVVFHVDATNMDVVVPCRRHHEAFELMYNLGFVNGKDIHRVREGFLDNNSNFLDRVEAYHHALQCGQLSATVRQNINNDMLFSEDLY